MHPPDKCPVCESNNITPVYRKNIGAEPDESAVLAYRCEKGHTFLVDRDRTIAADASK